MLSIPVLFNKSDEVYTELAAIAANNYVSCIAESYQEQITCMLQVDRASLPGFIKDLEASRYSQLKLLASRVIVESDSRFKSASRRYN